MIFRTGNLKIQFGRGWKAAQLQHALLPDTSTFCSLSRYVIDARWYEAWQGCVDYLEESPTTSDIAGIVKGPEAQDDVGHKNPEVESEVPPHMTASDPGMIISKANGTGNIQAPWSGEPGRVPGPIDNSALMSGTDTNVDMKRNLVEYEDYELLPEGVYSLLESWYDGGPRLPRSVIARGTGSNVNISVELWPLRVHIYICKPSGAPQRRSIAEILVSRMITLSQLRSNVLSRLNLSSGSETRVSFRVKPVDSTGAAATEAAKPETRRNVKRQSSRGVRAKLTDEAEWLEVELESNYSSSSHSDEGGDGPVDDEWHIVEPRMMQRKLDTVLADDGLLDLAALVEIRSSPSEEFPRDHIVNKWRQELKAGDEVDAMDIDGKWYESVVREINSKDDTICVHYKGWQPKWDMTLNRSDTDIQPLHTHTEDWWKDIVVGSQVEIVNKESDGKSKWFRGTICEFSKDDSNLVHVEWAGRTKSVWYDKMGEEICCIGTHTKNPVVVPGDDRSSLHGPLVSKGGGGDVWGKRFNTKAPPPEPGAVGLYNLGNTCFMNSMIQCLSHTMAWTKYFRCGEWRHDLNEDNPLGMQGLIAKEYAALIKLLWSGDFSCVSPSDLKRTIGQFAPTFAGFCQQDSQELMVFLLDGLHEGLNRVHQKPYVENFRSDRLDDSTIAEECWRRYLMRNDSIFVDSHHGLLRSHVTCPNCKYESITFDPYIQLQLAIPVEPSVTVHLRYIPIPKHYWDWSKDKVRVGHEDIQGGGSMDEGTRMIIHLEESATMLDVKKAVGVKVGVPFEQLYAVDVWKLKIWSVFDDSKPISSILSSDSVWMFQLEHPVTTGSVIRPLPLPNSSSAPNAASNKGRAVNVHFIMPRVSTQEFAAAPSDTEIAPPLALSLTNTTTNAQVHERIVSHLLVFLQRVVEPVPILADARMDESSPDVTVSADEDTEVVGMSPQSSQKLPSPGTSMRVEDFICVSSVVTQAGGGGGIPCKNTSRIVHPDNSISSVCLFAKKSEELRVELKLEACKFWKPKDIYSDKFGAAEEAEEAEEASISLDTCIDKFVEMEELGPTEQWYCINCKGSYQAFKKMDVWSTPDILIIHLKRFLQHMNGSYSVQRTKIDVLLDFPVNGLDLSPYLKSCGAPIYNDAPPIYDLYAVSEHVGGLRGGHYTSVTQGLGQVCNTLWNEKFK